MDLILLTQSITNTNTPGGFLQEETGIVDFGDTGIAVQFGTYTSFKNATGPVNNQYLVQVTTLISPVSSLPADDWLQLNGSCACGPILYIPHRIGRTGLGIITVYPTIQNDQGQCIASGQFDAPFNGQPYTRNLTSLSIMENPAYQG
jgi:hypothetical protein